MKTQGGSALKPDARYTAADYRSWTDEERWELIDGVAWSMSPAPSRQHQKLVVDLGGEMRDFLKGKPCEVYVAPIDVYLADDPAAADEEIVHVVQPDVLVVCDPKKLVDEGIRGAPDFIAEVLSPSTALKDLEQKKALYEQHGVREYWTIRPDGSLFVWVLDGPRFAPAAEYRPEQAVPSAALPGFTWPPRGPAQP